MAPYEADAQLAFEFHNKRVVAVLTEDSDLITHGCRVITDFNRITGQALLYDATPDGLAVVDTSSGTRDLLGIALAQEHGVAALWRLAVLNSCDYAAMQGIGRVKALTIVQECGLDDAAIKAALRKHWRGKAARNVKKWLVEKICEPFTTIMTIINVVHGLRNRGVTRLVSAQIRAIKDTCNHWTVCRLVFWRHSLHDPLLAGKGEELVETTGLEAQLGDQIASGSSVIETKQSTARADHRHCLQEDTAE